MGHATARSHAPQGERRKICIPPRIYLPSACGSDSRILLRVAWTALCEQATLYALPTQLQVVEMIALGIYCALFVGSSVDEASSLWHRLVVGSGPLLDLMHCSLLL